MLISTHMQDLKDVTEDVHYENFRAQCISQISQHALRERGYVRPPLYVSFNLVFLNKFIQLKLINLKINPS